MRSRWLAPGLLVALLAGLLGWPRLAGARSLSGYEAESLRMALAQVKGTVDPAPGTKWIEAIDVVTLEVFDRRDPVPGWLNIFHTTTKPKIVERELLLKVGDRYDPALAEESERNLRVRQISVVLTAPLRGSAPDRVRLLVVTKDVWSLRVNFEPLFVNGNLQGFVLQPSEENLFGRHKTLNATFQMGRLNYAVGVGYVDPRIGGSRLLASTTANLVFDCNTNAADGSYGSFAYGKPLYSTRTRWGWAVATAWNDTVVRPAGTIGQSVCAGKRAVGLDFASTRKRDDIPYQYRQDLLSGQFSAVRSYGLERKNDLSFGFEVKRSAYIPPDLSGEPPSVQSGFARLLPVNDTRIGPFVQVHSFENRFLRVTDFETLGLQEDYRLGYDLWLKAYPAAAALGSSRTLLGTYAGAGYTLPFGDGLVRAYAATTYELSKPETTDGQVRAGARVVTPKLPFGRVVFDGYVLDRFENYLNPSRSLGGTTRLRGYRPQAFVGPNVLAMNLEARSIPVEILTVQVGAVAFYDVGDAFRGASDFGLKHGIGGGLRFVFPQIDRAVFRVDLGIPLNPGDPAAETTVIAQFYQAFPVPELSPSALYPNGSVERSGPAAE